MTRPANRYGFALSRPFWQGPSPLPCGTSAPQWTEAKGLRPVPARPPINHMAAGASPPPGGGRTVSHLAQTPPCTKRVDRRGERQCLSYPAPPASGGRP